MCFISRTLFKNVPTYKRSYKLLSYLYILNRKMVSITNNFTNSVFNCIVIY